MILVLKLQRNVDLDLIFYSEALLVNDVHAHARSSPGIDCAGDYNLVFGKSLFCNQRAWQIQLASRPVLVGAQGAQIGDDVVDLLRTQQLSPYRHDFREAARRPAMHDHVFPDGVRFGRSLIAPGEIGEGVRPHESRSRLRSAPPVAGVTSDTSRLEDALTVPNIWRLTVFQGLCEQQKSVRHEERAKGDDAKGSVHREVYLSEFS